MEQLWFCHRIMRIHDSSANYTFVVYVCAYFLQGLSILDSYRWQGMEQPWKSECWMMYKHSMRICWSCGTLLRLPGQICRFALGISGVFLWNTSRVVTNASTKHFLDIYTCLDKIIQIGNSKHYVQNIWILNLVFFSFKASDSAKQNCIWYRIWS